MYVYRYDNNANLACSDPFDPVNVLSPGLFFGHELASNNESVSTVQALYYFEAFIEHFQILNKMTNCLILGGLRTLQEIMTALWHSFPFQPTMQFLTNSCSNDDLQSVKGRLGSCTANCLPTLLINYFFYLQKFIRHSLWLKLEMSLCLCWLPAIISKSSNWTRS